MDRKKSPFLDACQGIVPSHTPVWFMRQAGRSLPEYRSARGDTPILESIQNPELSAELTLQPVKRYGVDAAILFSDIVVPLHAIGMGIDVVAGTGPVVSSPFRTRNDLDRIRLLEPETDIPYVIETVSILARELSNTPTALIGFAGAPFTLASYLIEGGPSKTYAKTKAIMKSDPDLWADLMDGLATLSASFLDAQVTAGAEAIQLFDSWAGSLSERDYRQFVLPFSTKVLSDSRLVGVPKIHFGVGTAELLGAMSEAGSDVIGVDWRTPLSKAVPRLAKPLALQGNLDPAICLAPWEVVEAEVDNVMSEAAAAIEAGAAGHVFNLGHGVLPETDPVILSSITDKVHTFSPAHTLPARPA